MIRRTPPGGECPPAEILLRAVRNARTMEELAAPLERLMDDLRHGRVSAQDARAISDAADRRFLKLRPRNAP